MRFIWLFVLKSIVTLGCNLNSLPACPDSYFAQTAVFRGLYNNEELRSAHNEYADFFGFFEDTPMLILTDIELAIQNDDLEAAVTFLSELPTDDLNYIEENYRTLYTLCLAYKSSEGLNESQRTELEGLCAQCPETDGACVYQARVLYMLVYSEPYEAPLCTDDDGARRAFYPDEISQFTRGRTKVTIYPNPSTSEVSIKLSKENGDVIVAIVDISGRTVLQKFYSEKTSLFNFQHELEPGIYLINLSIGPENVTKKFIVAH